MTGPDLLACLGTALLLGISAERFVPRLAGHWIPHPPGPWLWPARLSIAAGTTAAVGLLIWQHRPQQPTDYLLLAAWLTFTLAGVLLSAIDIHVHRLPTPIITATAATLLLLLATGAALTRRPTLVVVPVLAAAVLGGGYLLIVAAGASGAGMGDVRLAALTGLVLGTAGWHTVLYGALLPYLLAGPFAFAVARRRTVTIPVRMPFGPFLVGGAVLAGAFAGHFYA